jgi:hypothetical protein
MFSTSFSFSDLICLIQTISCPALKDKPKKTVSRVQKNHSVSSIDLIFCRKPPLFLAVFDIPHRGEVGLAPLHLLMHKIL